MLSVMGKIIYLHFYRFYDCESIDTVDYLTIYSVNFVNSLCILKKKKSESNIFGSLHITITDYDVFSRNKNSQGLKNVYHKRKTSGANLRHSLKWNGQS